MAVAFRWLNEPAEWQGDADRLTLTTDDKTDFWRETFYGFVRDSGHSWLTPVRRDFSATASFTGDYRELYDQAGMMLRIDETHWIKAGIEYTDGLMHFSVVVTREVSDWSVIPLHSASPETEVFVRITRHDEAVRVQFHLGDGKWQMARLCPFPSDDATVGVTACSPERQGFEARFRDIRVGPAIPRKLHDD
jgi:regulation of enolase protein 1 (concanavalin A-like superfamily)